MLAVTLLEKENIALLEPDGELSQADFESAAAIIDGFLAASEQLNGIIIHVRTFPGWDSFAALLEHLKFVKNHHNRLAKVAFATDSPIGGIAEHVASHFISAQVKSFSFSDLENACQWILEETQA
jgi:hypothetical protein